MWVRKTTNDKWQVYVPRQARTQVILQYHDSAVAGHPGSEETERAIKVNYYWPEIRRDVRRHVELFQLCACMKASAVTNTGMTPWIPTKPWETVTLDLMGPYPTT